MPRRPLDLASPPARRRSRLRFRARRHRGLGRAMAEPERLPSRPTVRLRVVGAVVLVLFALLPLRLWALQVLQGRRYATASVSDYLRTVAVPAPRGRIVDRTGTVLAGDTTQEDIVLSRAAAAGHSSIVGTAAALVGATPAQIEQDLHNPRYSPYQPVPILRDAPPSLVQYLQTHRRQLTGLSVETVSRRTYPFGGSTATAVLGHTGPITAAQLAANPHAGYRPTSVVGKDGIEASYQQYLRGKSGSRKLAVNALGTVVRQLGGSSPEQGDTVQLNLDVPLQQMVDQALANGITTDRHTVDPTTGHYPGAVNGAVVVMNPNNGAILAMASYPTYNLNEWNGGISAAQYQAILSAGADENYAIQGLYTPGSTFKLATSTAALRNGLLTPSTVFHDPGTFTIPNCTGLCTFHDASPSDAGQITLPLALTESDDDYFYNIGYQFWVQQSRYGPDPIQKAAADYGFGAKTGVDLPGEAAGRVDSPALRQQLHRLDPTAFPNSSWYAGDNLELAFGQGATVISPIEMADAYATFANGGTRYKPEVAARILSPSGRVIKSIRPQVTGHVTLPPVDTQAMLQGFQGAVSSPKGTAYGDFVGFPLQTFPLAGKTGTASISHTVEPDSWFVGFGPLPHPQYLVVATVGQGGYGSAASAPIVRKVFDYLVAHPVPTLSSPAPSSPAHAASGTTRLAAPAPHRAAHRG